MTIKNKAVLLRKQVSHGDPTPNKKPGISLENYEVSYVSTTHKYEHWFLTLQGKEHTKNVQN